MMMFGCWSRQFSTSNRKERKLAMAKETEKKKAGSGYPGWTGPAEEVAGVPPEALVDMPEGTVIGQGTVSTPTVVEPSSAFSKELTKDKRFAGLMLMEGNTFHGFHYKQFAELTEVLTEDGVFNTFRGYHPDAIREGFKAKAVTKEEAEKLVKEWAEKKSVKSKKDED